jgi:uncharacterized protein DUF222/HNH endonuclease
MSSTTRSGGAVGRPDERLEVLFEELAEVAGQRNAIDGRIVEIVAELDREELCGATGARTLAALAASNMGSSSGNANTIATVARRLEAFRRCAQGMREGRRSLDQVDAIAARAADGSDEHYPEPARYATVNQLRTAVKLEPRPQPDPGPPPQPSITGTCDENLEHRHPTCAVPGCTATRELRAHHIQHWEDDGPTELANLVLLCPYQHRLHRRGIITIAGPADPLTITDRTRQCRPPPDPPASAPTGGGINRSSRSQRRQTTRSTTRTRALWSWHHDRSARSATVMPTATAVAEV